MGSWLYESQVIERSELEWKCGSYQYKRVMLNSETG